MKSERILLLALAVSLGLGCFLILRPFLPAMLWAAILVYCLWPVYIGFSRYVRPSLSAFLITLAVATVVLVPLVHLALVVAKEARAGRGWVQDVILNGLPPAPAFLAKIPLMGSILTDFWNNSADDLGGAAASMQPVLGTVAHSGIRLLSEIAHGLIGTVVALFISYFFFLAGEQFIMRIRLLLVRIMNESRVEHLFVLVAATVRGVVFGILGTAAMQGILYAIGFEIARVPQALLLASLAGLVSIVPAGAVIVYVPLCLYLLAQGHPVIAVMLAVYCFVVVGGADSIVRPWLISKGASLPYALTLIGVLGGAIAFGALGIFLGPVLLALGLAVAEEFAGESRGAWRQP
ncbi:AI-2E family transporter [Acidocella sp.]|uniref:AI-2E family transporter n=1 Tax=Acidocella sp. TaxID=50710 RepID=UPI0026349C17|nr:AI-2E family transporter [Acidocella sp.]MDD2795385.1 AI-2E family transporter [Acidocella sp.]